MESLVLELQREAYGVETSMTDLLRKAYVLSKKLNLEEISNWLSSEMEGYALDANLPEYRRVMGQPLKFGFPSKLFSKKGVYAPISEIEYYLQHNVIKKKGIVYLHFTSKDKRNYKKVNVEQFRVESSQLYNILDRVRNFILDWTLELEERGILGENMTFSEQDQKNVSENLSIINNIGNMFNSQLQQNRSNSVQWFEVNQITVESLKVIIEKGNTLLEEIEQQEIKEELHSELEVLKAQMNSPKPKNVIIKESLSTIRNIAEGITGSMAATGLLQIIEPLIMTLT